MTFLVFNCLAATASVVVLLSCLFLLEGRAVTLEMTGFLAVVAIGVKESGTDNLSFRSGGVTHVVTGEDDFRLASVEADLAEHLVGAGLATGTKVCSTVARVAAVTRVAVGNVKSECGHFLIEFGLKVCKLDRVF